MAATFATDALIRFENVTKKYRKFSAVTNLNLEIRKGEILGFLGPNGAGKTTTIKMLAGLLHLSDGQILIKRDGDWLKLTPSTQHLVGERMGFLIELPTFYDAMTPRQILTYFAKISGCPRAQVPARVEEVIAMIGLRDWIDQPIKNFSKGMRQRLGIVAAVIHNPDIIVLDEPQSGLDPQGQKEMRDFIRKLRDEGKTIFISSHILYEISEIANRIAIISHGNLVALDTLENLELTLKHSIIHVKVLPKLDPLSARQIVEKYTPIISELAGIPGTTEPMKYNAETQQFEVMFNGSPEIQHAILKALMELQVIEFSTPRASRLEDVYLEIVKGTEDKKDEDHPKSKKRRRD